MIWRIAAAVIALALVYAAGESAWRALTRHAAPVPASSPSAPAVALNPSPLNPSPPNQTPLPASAAPAPCPSAPAFAAAARQNAASLETAVWSVFGRPETGWEIYEPLVAHEIGVVCAAQADGFAQALAIWQNAHGLPLTGVMDAPTLKALNLVWLRRRPFVAASGHGVCPPPPAPDHLAWAARDEGYSGKPIQLRPAALAAYRALVAAARAEVPAAAADRRLLTVFSGYRDPVSDAANCARDGNCGTTAKANCSAHRTGLAMDVYLGAAPGYPPESSADPNRLYQSRSAAYRWLAANAERFGFAGYPFEPWHWEWTGEAP
ncbi:MAG: D-alanyl-D-alanine carboxypeptidase [Caulobacteraceae bacterium]|nr:D-alanyl-D-alanine carboxypeptidase [Caulobacteraceae bacterium]